MFSFKVCSECSTRIEEGSVMITINKETTKEGWHPECFR